MKKWLVLCIMCLAVLLFMPYAYAETVSSGNSDWVLLPNSLGPNQGTWGFPAQSQYGNENEPTQETPGNFLISAPLVLPNGAGYWTIQDDSVTGPISDVITVGNTGPGGIGEFMFYSDPSLIQPAGYNYGSLGYEGQGGGNGFTGTLPQFATTNGTIFTVEVASDNEIVFDPFGYGYDTSDQIKFTGVTPVGGQVPEPATMLLYGLGFAGAGLYRRMRRKMQK